MRSTVLHRRRENDCNQVTTIQKQWKTLNTCKKIFTKNLQKLLKNPYKKRNIRKPVPQLIVKNGTKRRHIRNERRMLIQEIDRKREQRRENETNKELLKVVVILKERYVWHFTENAARGSKSQ
jgi:hypothetical protein